MHVLVILLFVVLVAPLEARADRSYSKTKSALYTIVFEGQRETLYCGCAFSENRKLIAQNCSYSAGKRNRSSHQIQIEHIVPAARLGQNRTCWKDRPCVSASGKRLSGRACCLASDPEFRDAYQDMHNLWPALGQVNQRRANFSFGHVAGEEREFGRCDMEVDSRLETVEPPVHRRGEIARAYRHMDRLGYIDLSTEEEDQFRRWDDTDPPDEQEFIRHHRIMLLTGQTNEFTTSHASHDQAEWLR